MVEGSWARAATFRKIAIECSSHAVSLERMRRWDRNVGPAPAGFPLPAENEEIFCLAGGAEGNRTPDLCSAIAALSHLSYSPAPPAGRRNPKGSGAWERLP